MDSFHFVGEIPASKSILNRALICRSYESRLELTGDSGCDDVVHMKSALESLQWGLSQGASLNSLIEIDCGEAGTVLRFMALRVSRERGRFRLKGSPRLLARPHQELLALLNAFQVHAEIREDSIEIDSQGWKKPSQPVLLTRQSSSQFASAVLLNVWNLDFDLELEIPKGVSEAYFHLTSEMIQKLGCQISKKESSWTVPKFQVIQNRHYDCELDMSSAFPIVAAGLLAGKAVIENWRPSGFQPDQRFVQILQNMGAHLQVEGAQLMALKSHLIGRDIDLGNSPDLFPVLAILAAFAQGTSRLFGAPHLKFKESNRILKTKELLDRVGCQSQVLDDGLEIDGQSFQSIRKEKWSPIPFDPDQDHRMAMAAGLLQLQGFPITVLTPQVVAKSFPEYWQILKSSQLSADRGPL